MNDKEIMELAMSHNVDGCLSHNIKLFTFANACENIGMEKAAKICEPSNMDNPSDWTEYARAKTECADAIRKAI